MKLLIYWQLLLELLLAIRFDQIHCAIASAPVSYEAARQAVIDAEMKFALGGRLHLNNKEQQVDELFLKHKQEELVYGFTHTEENASGMHFFNAKPLIEKSLVFKFLRAMPKGALLHAHNSAMVSSRWFVRNIGYMSGLLRCVNKKGVNILTFRKSEQHECATQYVSIHDERQHAVSPKIYDEHFEKLINLYTPQPAVDYPTISDVWTKFQNMFSTVNDVLEYLPAFRAYHWQLLEELYDDNIMYAEIRMNFKQLYDRSGRLFPIDNTIKELLAIVEEFRQHHTNFIGIKVIHAVHRNTSPASIRTSLQNFKSYHAAYPNFIIGFDLVGQEDLGKPLYDFIKVLHSMPDTSRFFFHAGETNWYGSSSDYNLLDAILLNATRIGHGYALMKHPVLWNAVKKRNIAIEISPISNQVLHLVSDLRNHAASFYMSENIPIVICNDDPGFWNAKGLSYDFYYAIMSFAANNAGLKTLKTLVWNSINYSFMTAGERKKALMLLERNWNDFIENVLLGLVF